MSEHRNGRSEYAGRSTQVDAQGLAEKEYAEWSYWVVQVGRKGETQQWNFRTREEADAHAEQLRPDPTVVIFQLTQRFGPGAVRKSSADPMDSSGISPRPSRWAGRVALGALLMIAAVELARLLCSLLRRQGRRPSGIACCDPVPGGRALGECRLLAGAAAVLFLSADGFAGLMITRNEPYTCQFCHFLQPTDELGRRRNQVWPRIKEEERLPCVTAIHWKNRMMCRESACLSGASQL